MKVSTLTRLGLTENAALTYLTLVGSGPQTVAAVAKAAGIHRPAVYRAIADLTRRRLVAPSPRGRRRLYVAESPEKLEGLLGDLRGRLEEELPALVERHRSSPRRPVVTYDEGREAIRAVFADLVTSLKKGDVFYRYSSKKYVEGHDRFMRYYPKNYQAVRDAKQLERFVITSETSKRRSKQYATRAIKAVPARYGLFDYDVTTLIYGNKVAYLDFAHETALVVENDAIAAYQRKLFQILYERL